MHHIYSILSFLMELFLKNISPKGPASGNFSQPTSPFWDTRQRLWLFHQF